MCAFSVQLLLEQVYCDEDDLVARAKTPAFLPGPLTPSQMAGLEGVAHVMRSSVAAL